MFSVNRIYQKKNNGKKTKILPYKNIQKLSKEDASNFSDEIWHRKNEEIESQVDKEDWIEERVD